MRIINNTKNRDSSLATQINDMNGAWAKVNNKISETKLTYYQSTCHYQDAVSKLCCLQNRHTGIFAGGQKINIGNNFLLWKQFKIIRSFFILPSMTSTNQMICASFPSSLSNNNNDADLTNKMTLKLKITLYVLLKTTLFYNF